MDSYEQILNNGSTIPADFAEYLVEEEFELFDLTLTRELTELLGKNFTFPEIEAIGKYLFKHYSTHSLEKKSESITISALNAAKRLVYECEEKDRLDNLFTFVIELDDSLLSGKRVKIKDLEKLLYKLACSGVYYDYKKRKLKYYNQDKKILNNWGILKDGREYPITIASLDICDNSTLVKNNKSSNVEKSFFLLWEFIRNKLELYDGRIWSWAGDGGILAFRNENGSDDSVACCMEILLSLPVFNASMMKKIPENIDLRIGIDTGIIKFYSETGRIVSGVINYASKLEKKATCPNGISVSEDVYKQLFPAMKKMFNSKSIFEGKNAYTMNYDFGKALS